MAEKRILRRLVAVSVVDMVGYSRAMGADEEGTLARLNVLRNEILHPKISEFGGRIVKTMSTAETATNLRRIGFLAMIFP